MKNKSLWLILLVFGFTLGCGLFSGIGSRIDEAKETAAWVATDAQLGYSVLATARAIVTEVGSQGVIETGQALATAFGDSGLLETAQAFATEQGPGLMETGQAALTQAAPILGEAPPDIPLLSGELLNLVATSHLITYETQFSLQEAEDFYREEMPKYGWNPGNEQSFGNILTLEFEKSGRSAVVTLTEGPGGSNTMVVIAIQ